jgi:hypothetical protein
MLAYAYVQLLNDMRQKGNDHPDINAKLKLMTIKERNIFDIYETGDNQYKLGERQVLDLYYDSYEKYYGEGYFLSSENCKDCDAFETHVFQKHNDAWCQISGDCIDGLDGDNGIKLLDRLNETKELQITAKLCLNRIKSETDVVRAEPNELTRPEFVCKVVDEMINCAWKAQAEEILSYVGGYNCKKIISRDGKVLYPKPRRI